MRLLGVVLDIIGRSERVDRCFEVDDIPFSKLFRIAIERQELDSGETLVDPENAVRAVVASSDGDLAGLEPGLRGNQCTFGRRDGNYSRMRQRWH
jgi:hypothetical protein